MEHKRSMLGEKIGAAAQKVGLMPPQGGRKRFGSDQESSTGSNTGSDDQVALKNRAGESRSPYVRGHRNNPVAWQLWGDEAIELAKKENKLLFVSIGYSACHWCHVMEHESFENDEVAAVLNSNFIPIKIDREERPDIDRIYMNFVQATTGSGGWPLNVFVTPTLEPVFGGTYWPGPQSHTRQLELEEQVDFLGILNKLATVWREQEARCRLDSATILEQLRSFAAEGTLGSKSRLGEGEANLDLDLLDDSYQHLAKTFDTRFSGFGEAPKFPTAARLSFLIRLRNFPQPVVDIVGQDEVNCAQFMALSTLRAMDRGGIHDHIGHGFARYSVTEDWSLPHFEKMLYDNAQLLHVYLDAFFGMGTPDAELLGVVYDLAKYLTQTRIAAPSGGFYSSEDADSYYRKGDEDKREGAYYVWTQKELEQILDRNSAEILCEFFGVLPDGNVEPEHDVHDEFINQNVLKITKTPAQLAQQFGVEEKEIVKIIKEGKEKLRVHRERERVQPNLDDKIVCAWNGIAIGALARTGAALSKVDEEFSKVCFDGAIKATSFIRREMYDEKTKTLRRVWREGPGDTAGFADDYAFLIDGLIDLYETTFDDSWLKWADELQATQIELFHDTPSTTSPSGGGGFFATTASATHTILRLKDGMDNAEPSANGISASNLFRLASLLGDEGYDALAKGTLTAFEAEIMQYPWLFSSFMPGIVAASVGVRGVVKVCGVDTPLGGASGQRPISKDAPIDIRQGVVGGETTTRNGLVEAGEAVQKVAKSHANLSGASAQSSHKSFNPANLATQLQFITLSDNRGPLAPLPKPKPRGALETRSFVDDKRGVGQWLKKRNKLVGELRPLEGRARIMVCEGGVCREAGDGEGEGWSGEFREW